MWICELARHEMGGERGGRRRGEETRRECRTAGSINSATARTGYCPVLTCKKLARTALCVRGRSILMDIFTFYQHRKKRLITKARDETVSR